MLNNNMVGNSINLATGTMQLYGSEQTIYCGDSDSNTPPGHWFHDGAPLTRFGRSYTITNATFDDDGKYQCKRNGTKVFSTPLQVDVYGKR